MPGRSARQSENCTSEFVWHDQIGLPYPSERSSLEGAAITENANLDFSQITMHLSQKRVNDDVAWTEIPHTVIAN